MLKTIASNNVLRLTLINVYITKRVRRKNDINYTKRMMPL